MAKIFDITTLTRYGDALDDINNISKRKANRTTSLFHSTFFVEHRIVMFVMDHYTPFDNRIVENNRT